MAVKHKYTHTLHALAFTIMALSGLAVMIKGNNAFGALFAGKKNAEVVHKVVAWVYLFTNSYLGLKILPEMGIRGNLTVKALFQRLFYWFVFLSLVIMVPTGLLLMFKQNFSAGLVLFTLSIHKTFALILIGITVIHAFLRFHKPGMLFEEYKEICRKCVEKLCIGVCPTWAISVASDGSIAFDDVRCIACNKCVEVCPYKVVYYSQRGVCLYVKPINFRR